MRTTYAFSTPCPTFAVDACATSAPAGVYPNSDRCMSATGQGRQWPAGGWRSRSTPSFGMPRAFPHLRFGPIPLIATTLPLEVFTDSHERSQLRCVTSGLAETVGLEERIEDVVALAMGAKLAKPNKLSINVWGMPRSALPAWTSRPRCAARGQLRVNRAAFAIASRFRPTRSNRHSRHSSACFKGCQTGNNSS